MPKIKIFLYSSCADMHQQDICNGISEFSGQSVISDFKEVTAFGSAVEKAVVGENIIVMLIRDENELDAMLKIQNQLKDHPLLVVLWDCDTDCFRKASRLYPRYISYLKNDYTDILQVLKKINIKIQNRLKGGQSNV